MDSIKKFEDFLDRMQGLLDNAKKQGHILVRVEDLESTFPELQESEDEKIRKALIEMVHDTTGDELWVDYNIHKEEALAWLEKQGETFTKKDVDDAYLKGVCDAKNELEKQSEQKDTLCDKCKKEQPSHSCQDITALGRCAIEKQDEQKFTHIPDIEIPFGARDSELQEASYHIPEGFYAEIDGNRVVIKQGEQKPVEWSEEDDYNLQCMIAKVTSDIQKVNVGRNNELIDWLNSLKERMGGKP